MLNLQAVNRATIQLETAHKGGESAPSSCTTDSLVFERVVGSLGSSVVDDRSRVEDETI